MFYTGGAFTRLLVGNEDISSASIQVTHSNFDYSKVPSDYCESNHSMHMSFPNFNPSLKQSLVFFPTNNISSARVTINSGPDSSSLTQKSSFTFSTSDLPYELPLDSRDTVYDLLIHPLIDSEPLPSRIPFGVCTSKDSSSLHSEMSLGAYSSLRPNKRFHWVHFLHDPSSSLTSTIYASAVDPLYGPPPQELICRIYIPGSTDYLESTLKYTDLQSGLSSEHLLEIF